LSFTGTTGGVAAAMATAAMALVCLGSLGAVGRLQAPIALPPGAAVEGLTSAPRRLAMASQSRPGNLAAIPRCDAGQADSPSYSRTSAPHTYEVTS
jgi:hypothetical protein